MLAPFYTLRPHSDAGNGGNEISFPVSERGLIEGLVVFLLPSTLSVRFSSVLATSDDDIRRSLLLAF